MIVIYVFYFWYMCNNKIYNDFVRNLLIVIVLVSFKYRLLIKILD